VKLYESEVVRMLPEQEFEQSFITHLRFIVGREVHTTAKVSLNLLPGFQVARPRSSFSDWILSDDALLGVAENE
jgi:hypothetical protein